MIKTKEQTKRRKGQSASKATLGTKFIDLELLMRTNEFRKFVGPRRSKDLNDYQIRRVRGLSAWEAFNAGWNAAIESRKPTIKAEPLTKRTHSA